MKKEIRQKLEQILFVLDADETELRQAIPAFAERDSIGYEVRNGRAVALLEMLLEQ